MKKTAAQLAVLDADAGCDPLDIEELSSIITLPLDPIESFMKIIEQQMKPGDLDVPSICGCLLEQAKQQLTDLAHVLEERFGEIKIENRYGNALFPWGRDLKVFQGEKGNPARPR